MGLAKVLPILRFIVLGIVLLFSLICLAIAAHFLYTTEHDFGGMFYFTPLAIGVGGLTFLSTILILILDLVTRGNAFTSKIVFDVFWFGFLFIAWMGTAGYTAWTNSRAFPNGCIYRRRFPTFNMLCHELPAVDACAFIIAFVLLFWIVLLVVFTIISRGRVFTQSPRQLAATAATPASTAATGYPGKVDYPAQYPQQYVQPPMQTGYGYPAPAPGMQVPPGTYPPQMQYQAVPAPGQYPQSPMQAQSPYMPTMATSPSPSNETYTNQSYQQGYPNYQAGTPPNAGDAQSATTHSVQQQQYPPYQAGTPPNAGGAQAVAGYPQYQAGTPPNAGSGQATAGYPQYQAGTPPNAGVS